MPEDLIAEEPIKKLTSRLRKELKDKKIPKLTD